MLNNGANRLAAHGTFHVLGPLALCLLLEIVDSEWPEFLNEEEDSLPHCELRETPWEFTFHSLVWSVLFFSQAR